MNHPNPRRETGRGPARGGASGFTLIELLVVIAIIALLAAVLLPTLNRVKQAGYLAVCRSNVHQWGIASRMYLDTFRDTYPPTFGWYESLKPFAFSGPSFGGWTNGQPGFASGVDVCPGFVRLPGLIRPVEGLSAASYAYNAFGRSLFGARENGVGLAVGPGATNLAPVRSSDVTSPSRMIELGDSIATAVYVGGSGPDPGTGIPHTRWCFVGDVGDLFENGLAVRLATVAHGSGLGGPTLPDGLYQDPTGPLGVEMLKMTLNGFQRRHRGQWNMLCCDGHVESWSTPTFLNFDDARLIQRWNRDDQVHR